MFIYFFSVKMYLQLIALFLFLMNGSLEVMHKLIFTIHSFIQISPIR